MTEGREILRCPHADCRLMQFRTKSGRCRKCKRAYVAEKAAAVPAKIEPIPPAAKIYAYGEAKVSQAVIAVRKTLSYSQQDVAERMGVNRTWVCKIERGRVLPSIPSLIRIARALNIAPWLLLELAIAGVAELPKAEAAA